VRNRRSLQCQQLLDQELFNAVQRQGMAEVVDLHFVAAMLPKVGELSCRLDSFGFGPFIFRL
jgi:hypothetical protein